LKAYGRKYLGGEIGFTTVLHTWGQDMSEHVHLHCIVTGGALQQTGAGERWRPCAKGFLFPIVSISRERVRFTYHDNKYGGREKVIALPALEFIRRFLLHVLPSRFVHIRHYGLHHSSKRGALERSRALLGLSAELPEPPELVMSEWVESFLGRDPRLCPFCEQGRMFRYRDFEPVSPTKSVILSVFGIPIRGQVVG
jgi:hypothetical protein